MTETDLRSHTMIDYFFVNSVLLLRELAQVRTRYVHVNSTKEYGAKAYLQLYLLLN